MHLQYIEIFIFRNNVLIGTNLLNILVSVTVNFSNRKVVPMKNIKSMIHYGFLERRKQRSCSVSACLVKVDFPCCTSWLLREAPKYTDLLLSDAINHNFYINDFLSLSLRKFVFPIV